jgi:AraC-like DNA-binding protein/uncharacterized cupin superfamily protein
MPIQSSVTGKPSAGDVQKLVEYRTAHYATSSEGSRYFTNTPARVQFRFSNPILCQLISGKKVMSIEGGPPFDFGPDDAMFVPGGQSIDIDLGAASFDQPIECLCIEIEGDRMDSVMRRVNEAMSVTGASRSLALKASGFSVLRGDQARQLGLVSLMQLFEGDRDVFSDLRIDARIDEVVLKLLQQKRQELVINNNAEDDTGVHTVARVIRTSLDRHIPISDLAQIASMSESSLHRHFRKYFGTSPSRFANHLRIAKAKKSLRQSQVPIEELAFELGFSDASHFSRVFRKSSGESPAEYRKRRQKPPNMMDW